MPNEIQLLSHVFRALGDPTRRAVVLQLCNGPASVSELAKTHDMALPSFVQHLQVLEDCGLIRSHKEGRVRTCEVVPEHLAPAEQWLVQARAYWEDRMDALVAHIEADTGRSSKGDEDE